jgi:O-antigen/teichoic acid export membrane protein
VNPRVLRNALYTALGQAGLLILWFAVVRTVFRGLGSEILGLLYFSVLVTSVTSSLGDVGISSTVVREVSSRLPAEPDHVRRLLKTFSLVYWGGFLALAAAMIIGAPMVARHWLKPQAVSAEETTRFLRILGVGALLALPRSLYTSVFRGMQRMDVSSLLDVGAAALQQVGALIVMRLGGGTSALFLWWGGSVALGVALSFALARRALPAGALVPGWYPDALSTSRRFTSGMFSLSLLSLVHTHLDKVVVGKLLPLGAFGFYGVAFSTVTKGTLPAAAVGQAAFPSFAAMSAADRSRHLWPLLEIVSFGTLPLFAAMPFFATPVLRFALDAGAAAELLLPIALLATAFYMNGALQPLSALALGAGRPDIAVRFNLYALAVGLPAMLLLVRAFGLVGAGLGWIVYHVLAYAYSVPRIFRECLGESPRRWYAHALGTLAVGLALYTVAFWGAQWMGGGLGALTVAYVAATAAFAMAASHLMSEPTREQVRRALSRVTRARGANGTSVGIAPP